MHGPRGEQWEMQDIQSRVDAKNADSGSHAGLIMPHNQLCFPSFIEEKVQWQRPKRPTAGKPALQTTWEGRDHIPTIEGPLLTINAWLTSRRLSSQLPRITVLGQSAIGVEDRLFQGVDDISEDEERETL